MFFEELLDCQNSAKLIDLLTRKDIEVSERVFLLLGKKLKTIYIEQGELLPKEALLIGRFFVDELQTKDAFWQNVSQYFYKEYINLKDINSEKYIYNSLIFIADSLSLNYENALKAYIQRTLLLDTRGVDLKIEWIHSFGFFLLHVNPSLDIIIEAIKPILEPKNFFSLAKSSQRAVFYWWLHVVWTHKPYMNHEKWKEFELPLKILSDEVLSCGDISTQMYIHFFAYQILGNLYQTQGEWDRFNKAFNRPQCEAFKALHVKPIKELSAKKKKRMLFVKDRIVENSPYKVEFSLFSSLMNDEEFTSNYEICVLSMGYIDKAQDQEEEVKKLKDLGIHVVAPGQAVHSEDEYYDHLKKAMILRKWIIENEIDIMVGCVSGYDIMNFLFTCRSAPKQIYWSHGDFQYNVEGIDQRISHFKSDTQSNLYGQFHIDLLEHYLTLDVDMKVIKKERERYPRETLVLGSIGRLIKVNSDMFLAVLSKIMKKNLHVIYIAAGTGDSKGLRLKVEALGIANRFYMPGLVDAHLYGNIIDYWLSPFPFGGGTALLEYASKGKPYLIMENIEDCSNEKKLLYEGFIYLHGKKRIFALNKNDYFEVANYLINDDIGLEEVSNYVKMEYNNNNIHSSRNHLRKQNNYGVKGFLYVLNNTKINHLFSQEIKDKLELYTQAGLKYRLLQDKE